MSEILHDVEAVSVANHAQTDDVVRGVEQVGAMRRRKHQMLVAMFGIVIEGEIFALLVQQKIRGRRQAFGRDGSPSN